MRYNLKSLLLITTAISLLVMFVVSYSISSSKITEVGTLQEWNEATHNQKVIVYLAPGPNANSEESLERFKELSKLYYHEFGKKTIYVDQHSSEDRFLQFLVSKRQEYQLQNGDSKSIALLAKWHPAMLIWVVDGEIVEQDYFLKSIKTPTILERSRALFKKPR